MGVGGLPERCFAVCAPEGPSTPFAWPVLIWFDILRILIMVAGVGLIVLTPRLTLRAQAWGQRARLVAAGIFAAIAVGTEVDHLGDTPHYRLFLTFFGVVLMLYGVWEMRTEVPPRSRPRPKHQRSDE